MDTRHRKKCQDLSSQYAYATQTGLDEWIRIIVLILLSDWKFLPGSGNWLIHAGAILHVCFADLDVLL